MVNASDECSELSLGQPKTCSDTGFRGYPDLGHLTIRREALVRYVWYTWSMDVRVVVGWIPGWQTAATKEPGGDSGLARASWAVIGC